MRVARALNLTVSLSALAACVIFILLIAMFFRVERAMKAGNVADAIISSVFERGALREDFLRNRNERAKVQWLARHQETGRLLKTAGDRFWTAEDKATVQDMLRDHKSTGNLFNAIVRARAGQGGASDLFHREMEERFITQLMMRSYETVLHARQLQEAGNRHLIASLRLAVGSIAGTIALLAVAVLANAWIVGRTVTRRIATLQEGAAVVGAGNLQHRIAMEGDDEFVSVSQAFDAMTAGLLHSYRELEKEIAQRKRAEAALQKNQEELELRVAERTEELERIGQELEMQNEELQAACHQLELESESRVRAVEELRQKDRMLIQQGRLAAMGEMLGHIAHQWRQPLNVLGLTTQQLAFEFDGGGVDRTVMEAHVRKTMGILHHLSQTIDDFTAFAGPDRTRTLFPVAQVIDRTISLAAESFKSQKIDIEVTVDGSPEINGFPNEYVQVLLNILMNARDALLERKVQKPRVSVHAVKAKGRSVVTIRDNAGGIAEEVLEKIFDPYFTTKPAGKGTGIGLFMSKTIIEKNMGGVLTACNAGEGAEFTIEV